MTSAINVTTPDGVSGPWAIQSFSISENEAARYNLGVALKRMGSHHMVVPGDYKRLIHETRGVVMSNTPMEVRTNTPFLRRAKGKVLINGLGLGMVLHALVGNPAVTHITVVEIDKDVIALTAPHFQQHIDSGRLTIINADCFKHVPPKGERYDVVWHDIWDTITDDNLFDMTKLKLKYCKRTKVQLCWAENECVHMRKAMVDELHRHGKTWKEFQAHLTEKKAKESQS